MSFTSLEYLLLVAILWFCSSVLPWNKAKVIILFGSYFFYSLAEWSYIFLLFGVTMASYGGALAQRKWPHHKKRLCIAGVVVILVVLAVFKYLDFVIEQFGAFEDQFSFEPLGILLPAGISFFSFQAISFLVDFYRGECKKVPKFRDFALYMAFFPQLIAGPIERVRHIVPQIKWMPETTHQDQFNGVARILWGVFKKLVIADRFAIYVNHVYAQPSMASTEELWLATFCFGFQIYFDFSAYSDIAVGTARLFGIQLSENFNWPYLSRNVQDFWRRWHMTLGAWFRDYVYISLGGNRCSAMRVYMNIMFVMLLTGLWHGAAWGFVLWGGVHGLAMIIPKYISSLKGGGSVFGETRFGQFAAILITFVFVNLSWVMFRAETLSDALVIYKGMFGMVTVENMTDDRIALFFEILCLISLVFHILRGAFLDQKYIRPVLERNIVLSSLCLFVLSIGIIFLGVDSSQKFIYFAF